MIILQIPVGLILGILFGYMMTLVNKFNHLKHIKSIRLAICVFFIVAFPVAAQVSSFTESYAIGIFFFGFVTAKVWGRDKMP